MEVYNKSYHAMFLKISADCVVRAAIINNYIFGDAGKSLELKRIVFKPCEIVVSESDKLPKYCCRSCCKTYPSKQKFCLNLHSFPGSSRGRPYIYSSK